MYIYIHTYMYICIYICIYIYIHTHIVNKAMKKKPIFFSVEFRTLAAEFSKTSLAQRSMLLTLSHALFRTLSCSGALFLFFSFLFSPSLFFFLILSSSLSFSLLLFRLFLSSPPPSNPPLSRFLSLSHTHAHMYTHTQTHTHELSWIHGDIRGRLYKLLLRYEIRVCIDLCKYRYNMCVYIYMYLCVCTYTQMICHRYMETSRADYIDYYGVATISRLLEIIGLFCRISSFS